VLNNTSWFTRRRNTNQSQTSWTRPLPSSQDIKSTNQTQSRYSTTTNYQSIYLALQLCDSISKVIHSVILSVLSAATTTIANTRRFSSAPLPARFLFLCPSWFYLQIPYLSIYLNLYLSFIFVSLGLHFIKEGLNNYLHIEEMRSCIDD